MVGVRREKMVVGRFFDNWTLFLTRGGLRDKDGVWVARGQPAHHAACELGRVLLASGFDTLCMIDSDAGFDVKGMEQLRTLKEGQEFDVLQAFYTTRTFPMEPMWLKIDDKGKWYKDEVRTDKTEEVQAVGLHFTLIRRTIFEKLPRPWFVYPPDETTSEDVPFCIAAREAGFTVGATSMVKTHHWGEFPFGWDNYQAWMSDEDAGIHRNIPPEIARQS